MWRNSLHRNWFSLFYCPFLAWDFFHFHARHDNPCPILSSMPSMTFLSLSLSVSFFTMPGMNIPCQAQSPSLSENEACDISARQYSWAMKQCFSCLCCLYFSWWTCTSCNIKHFITINLNSYTAFNYGRAWQKIFHAETTKFQDLSRNFSFQAVHGSKALIIITFFSTLSK